jgi:hypothetical protein
MLAVEQRSSQPKPGNLELIKFESYPLIDTAREREDVITGCGFAWKWSTALLHSDNVGEIDNDMLGVGKCAKRIVTTEEAEIIEGSSKKVSSHRLD